MAGARTLLTMRVCERKRVGWCGMAQVVSSESLAECGVWWCSSGGSVRVLFSFLFFFLSVGCCGVLCSPPPLYDDDEQGEGLMCFLPTTFFFFVFRGLLFTSILAVH